MPAWVAGPSSFPLRPPAIVVIGEMVKVRGRVRGEAASLPQESK